MTPDPAPIPVTLLTGFLGSGKTTVLNHLVRQPELADTLVIINEFGEMALDHLLVAHSTENPVLELSSGCLCCTLRSDLVKTLREVTWRFSRNGRRQFRRVLIETTGLADPAPILHTLMADPQIAAKYRLDGVVATIDLATGWDTLEQHPEAVRQAAMADVLLLTKADLASAERRAALLRRLDGINRAAPRRAACKGVIAPAQLLDLGPVIAEDRLPDVERWLGKAAHAGTFAQASPARHDHGLTGHGPHDASGHDDGIRAHCFTMDEPIPEGMLDAWLNTLAGSLGGGILRVKGIVGIEGHDTPVAIHGVQHVFHPPASLPAWPGGDRRSRWVFITRNVGREAIEATFRGLRRAPREPER
jgi:G3E family GTPase